MKVCSKCNIEKEDSFFRVRVDKRIKFKRQLIYLNNVCKQCEAKIARENHAKRKINPEYRKKHAKWANEAYWRNRDKIIEYNKKRRATSEAKEKMKAYRKKNKDKIYQQEIITKKRYHEKNKNPITDKYVKNLLRTQGYKEISKELIEIKRAEILLSRIKNKIVIKPTGIIKKCRLCLKEKDRSEFYPIKGTNKVMYCCKDCSNEKSKQYRENKKAEL